MSIFDMFRGGKRGPAGRRPGVVVRRESVEVDRQVGSRREDGESPDVVDVLTDVLDGYSLRRNRSPREVPFAYVTYKEYYQCTACMHTWDEILTRNLT